MANYLVKCFICTVLIVSSSINALPVPKYLRTTTNIITQDHDQNQSRITNLEKNLENVVIDPTTTTPSVEVSGEPVMEKKDTILFQAPPKQNHGFGYIRRFHPVTSTTTTTEKTLVEIKSAITEPILSSLGKMIPKVVASVDTKNSDNMKMTVRNIEYPDIVLDPNTEQDFKANEENDENKNFIIPNQKNSLINTWLKDIYNFSKTEDKNDDIQIGFQSLFRLPNIKDKENSTNCPKNFRRNHHGKCVRPIKIKITIVEEEIDG